MYPVCMPQPLRRKNAPIDWDVSTVANHPVLTSGVGACITAYASTEAAMGVLLANLSWEGADEAVSTWSEYRTVRAKLEVLLDHAEAEGEGYKKMVKIIIDKYEPISKQRSKLAHGFFGIVTDRENEFAWRKGNAAAKHLAEGFSTSSMASLPMPPTWLYKAKDFQILAQDCADTFHLIRTVADYIPVIKAVFDPLRVKSILQ